MTSLKKNIFQSILGVLLIVPAFAQHPDNTVDVMQKLTEIRQQVIQSSQLETTEKINRLIELGLWDEAERMLKTAKSTLQLKLSKAELYFKQNKFKEAESLVNEVLRQNQMRREALLLKSKLHVQAWELKQAEAIAQKLLKVNPKDEAAALRVGRILMLQKKYDQALEWAKNVQQWNPENAEAYLLESDVHFWNQKPELAEQPLIKSLTLNPFNADARFNYGYAIWRRVDATQLNAMAAQWEIALELDPLHYVTHWHWGNGHTNLTYANYAQPEDEQVRAALKPADKLLSENKLKEALAEIMNVQEKYPSSILPAMLRGSAYYMAFSLDRASRLDSAEAIFKTILTKKKHYGPAHNALAAVIKQKQLTYLYNYDSLQQVIQNTIIRDPDNFSRVFPDVRYYPGTEIQKMVWSQLYESIVYFPFLSKQGEKFVIPPLHTDLSIAMGSPYFRQATTFDNRQWMDIRGVGSGAAAIEYVVRGSYLERNVVLHEYVHLFHGKVFTDAENRAVRALYYNAMKEGRTLDYYSANNEHEYLAQTYPAYFEPVKVHPLNHKSINTTADLKAKDPALYSFLDELVVRQRAYLAGNKTAMASNWAQVYLNLAQEAMWKKDHTRAATLLDTALVWDKTYQPALIAYAEIKQQQEEYTAAKEWLDKAKSINPAYAPIYLAEAKLLDAQKNKEGLNGKDILAEQIKLYSKALELEDDLLMRSYTSQKFREFYLEQGMAPEAIGVAETYIASAPIVSTYLRDRKDEAVAFANWLRGTSVRSEAAVVELSNLVTKKPQNYELRKQFANVLVAQGNYQEAYKTLEESQRILTAAGNPRADFTIIMAYSKLRSGDRVEAKRLIDSLTDKKPKLPGEMYELIGVYADLGMEEKAKNLISMIPTPDTKYEQAQATFVKGRLAESNNKISKAIKAYKKSLATYPYQLEVRNRLVALLELKGRKKEVLQFSSLTKNL
jgi:tetratricopeptide (TPR) repeat protein